MTIEVVPAKFTMVDFPPDELIAIAQRLATEIGLGDASIRIEVDETNPLTKVGLVGMDPIVIAAESGALEDQRRPRQLSDRRTSDVLGRLLMQALDRSDPSFGAPPLGELVTMAKATAWEAYAVGRLVRLGHDGQRQRRIYQFRNRHGFSDVADEVFAALWEADGLSYADIAAASDRALAASGIEDLIAREERGPGR